MNGGRLMSESATQAEGLLLSPSKGEVSPSAGSRLRMAREAAGLHIGALAVSLKVPVKKLEALEGDRIDLLPDAVFARALASSVCRTLKIDAAPILANLPQMTLARLVPETLAGGDTYREPDQGSGRSLRDLKAKPFVLIGLLLAVAAAVVGFYPEVEKAIPNSIPIAVPHAVESPAPAVNAGSPVVEPTLVATPTTVDKAVNLSPAVNVESVPPLVPPDFKYTPVASLPVVTATSAVPATSAPTVPASVAGILVLKAKGASWVEVTDSAGIVQLRKTMAGGETIGVSGGLPLSVIVGKADTTEVQIRGKSFDMTPITKDNVARFEVR